MHAGDTLVVRLLYRGQPVAGAHLHAGAAAPGVTATSDSAQAAAPAGKDLAVETGPDGVARVVVAANGLWNVRALHAAPAPDGPGGGNGAWEVFFATMVFSVSPRNAH